jgi:hypothetical protein
VGRRKTRQTSTVRGWAHAFRTDVVAEEPLQPSCEDCEQSKSIAQDLASTCIHDMHDVRADGSFSRMSSEAWPVACRAKHSQWRLSMKLLEESVEDSRYETPTRAQSGRRIGAAGTEGIIAHTAKEDRAVLSIAVLGSVKGTPTATVQICLRTSRARMHQLLPGRMCSRQRHVS